MPLNIPGILVPFQLIWSPRLVVPSLAVQDIRHLDWAALKRAGYKGAVFDKDNCLTIPHKDTLVPELQDAWKQCLDTFGPSNVLIVSNSAGTKLDAGGIQAESVSHHLSVPVLHHLSLKPSYSCISAIRRYFISTSGKLRDDELIIVGDRVFTDVVMANRMAAKSENGKGPLAILTTGVWTRESMGMRWCEAKLVEAVKRWTSGGSDSVETRHVERFIRDPTITKTKPEPVNFWKRIGLRFGS